MSAPRLERARALAGEVSAALTEGGLPGVLVTLDGAQVPQASRLRSGGAVVIRPPALEFPTYDLTTATWTLVVVCGPADNTVAAWTQMDRIIQALVDADFAITSADPESFQHAPQTPALPAYVITLTD